MSSLTSTSPVGLQRSVIPAARGNRQLHRVRRLTPPLRLDVRMSLFKDMMLKLPFLQDLTASVIEELVVRLKLQVYMKGDFVMYKGERGDWMGFICRGVCAVLIMATSVNYWRHPVVGLRRTLDMVASVGCFLYQLRASASTPRVSTA